MPDCSRGGLTHLGHFPQRPADAATAKLATIGIVKRLRMIAAHLRGMAAKPRLSLHARHFNIDLDH